MLYETVGFILSILFQPDADYVVDLVAPEMSRRGTFRAATVRNFKDFVQDVEPEAEPQPLYFLLSTLVINQQGT